MYGSTDINIRILLFFLTLLPFIFRNTSMPAIPSEDTNIQMLGSLDKSPCNVQHRGCVGHAFSKPNCSSHIVEPKTGIEFPGMLNSILAKDNQSNLLSEVFLLLVLEIILDHISFTACQR